MVTALLPLGQSSQILGALGLTASSRRSPPTVRAHLDQLSGIARLRLSLRDDECHAIADTADAIRQKHRSQGAEAFGAAPVFWHEVGRDAADILREGVDTGQDQRDAGSRLRRRNVDALYSRMGMVDNTGRHCRGNSMSSTYRPFPSGSADLQPVEQPDRCRTIPSPPPRHAHHAHRPLSSISAEPLVGAVIGREKEDRARNPSGLPWRPSGIIWSKNSPASRPADRSCLGRAHDSLSIGWVDGMDDGIPRFAISLAMQRINPIKACLAAT